MPTGDDDASSELETQFVARPGDEDVLWTVEEITAERGNEYRVKWAGNDPITGKPWAQSWVAKHDCTNDLAMDWKAKKKSQAAKKKQGRGTSGTLRSSGASKRRRSSLPLTSGTGTRRKTDKATSSSLDPVHEEVLSQVQLPSRSSSRKRKRPAEDSSPSTARAEAEDETQVAPRMATRSSAKGKAVLPDTQSDGMASRPSKKQKTIVEVLLPPISSDEEADTLSVPLDYPITTDQNEVQKTNEVSSDVPEEDEEDSSPIKGKDKYVPAKGAIAASSECEGGLSQVKMKRRNVSRRKTQGFHAHSSSTHSEDEEIRPHRFKKKATPKDKPPSEGPNDILEKEAEPVASSIKVGPPRGVKRRNKLRNSRPSSKPGPSPAKSQDNIFADERVPEEQPLGQPDHEATPSNDPPPRQHDNRTSVPLHISIPPAPPAPSTVSPHTTDLSPGARARLELFDRMMANDSISPMNVSEDVPHDSHLDIDVTHDVYDTFDMPDPTLPHNLPPPSKPKKKPSKVGTSSELVVPETESSNISQSQSPRKIISLPTIAVIAPSMSPSPQELQPNVNHTPKKLTTKITPSAFRPTNNARSRLDEEAPPSSIESFPSPRRLGKGKQKAVEEDELQSSPSEGEGNGIRPKKRVQRKITDSQLRRRGKVLSDQAQLAREAGRQKNRKPKRLKTIHEIVNSTSLQTSGTPLVFINTTEDVQEPRSEDAVDLSGGANSATLDTVEHSEVRPMNEEERERMRIELRQEEEENTQEAMGVSPPSPEEPAAVNGVDSQMPPSKSSKDSVLNGRVEDVSEHVEQPSADLVQVSVIAQASQELPRHSQTDPDPLLANRPPSSPVLLIPENLTDSSKRRLDEALSLLNVKSKEIERLERELGDERREVQRLAAQQFSEPTTPVRVAWDVERAQWAQERSKWEQEAALWETQRKKLWEENENLSIRLAESSHAQTEASAELAKLVAEQEIWVKEREAMIHDMTHRSAELAGLGDARGEYDESQREAEKSLCVKEKEKWDIERTALEEKRESLLQSVDQLTAAVASTKAALVTAEADREFLREQYVRASEFVNNVRKENTELEQRVKIAEGQAQEGVAGIKALFEGRVKALQADVDRWKRLAVLLQEKDRLTNDELRLRAAQAPELIALCDRLSEDNKSLDANLRRLGRAQQRGVQQRNKLFYDILLLKRERVFLRAKLSKLTRVANSDTSLQAAAPPPPIPKPVTDGDPNVDSNDAPILPNLSPLQPADVLFDEPGLFPCMWRPLLRDQCQHIFDTKEDLERHMYDHYRELRVQ